ncbi:hypothetical protein CRUP_014618, partial [Coryphaenoides rupestris]
PEDDDAAPASGLLGPTTKHRSIAIYVISTEARRVGEAAAAHKQPWSSVVFRSNYRRYEETCITITSSDCSDRGVSMKKIRSLLVAGAADYDCFYQHLRLLDGAFKLSAKDLRSQVVREACITVANLSMVLGNKFDHGAEAIVPILFNLIPNCAKVMATSGVFAIRFIIRHTHVPRLIPLITSNCTCKSVAVRRRCFDFLDLLLQEWQTHSLERHTAVLVDSIKKGLKDADSEARVEARNPAHHRHSVLCLSILYPQVQQLVGRLLLQLAAAGREASKCPIAAPPHVQRREHGGGGGGTGREGGANRFRWAWLQHAAAAGV